MTSRNTKQRNIVFSAVMALKNHPSADEVFHYIYQDHPSISRATVYRNLNRLAIEGTIKKVDIPSGADRFDYRLDDHYHFQCLSCGKVYDVNKEDVSGAQMAVNEDHGFDISSVDIVFKGLCPDCSKKKRN